MVSYWLTDIICLMTRNALFFERAFGNKGSLKPNPPPQNHKPRHPYKSHFLPTFSVKHKIIANHPVYPHT